MWSRFSCFQVLPSFCIRKVIHCLSSPDFRKNYQNFYDSSIFSNLSNTNLYFRLLILQLTSEIDVFFSILYVEFPTYCWNQHIFLMYKTKKPIKLQEYIAFDHKPWKLESNLKMNISKMEKTKSKKIMIIFTF